MRVVLGAGNANNSGKAGTFIVNANNDAANSNSNIGTRLSLFSWKRTKKINMSPATWQKKEQSSLQFGIVREELEVK